MLNKKTAGMRLLMVSLIVMMIAGLVPGGLITPNAAIAQMSVMQKTEANIVWVSPGSYHFAALDDDGRVWTWATNATGRDALGRTYTTTGAGTAPDDQGGQVTTTINPGETLPYIVQISSSYRNSYALDQEGNIWSWGLDNQSALGRSGSGALPGRVSLPSGIKAKWIGAGYFGCKFIDMEGNLWVFGSGSQNSLGTGATADQLLPVRLEDDVNGNSLLGLHFAMVESSDYIDTACALAITEDGKLYTWGRTTNSNYYPSDLQSAKPRYIGTYNTSDPIGSPDADIAYPFINTPLGSEIKSLTCGNGSMGFLTYSGEAYSWGTNSNVEGSGRLGQGHINAVALPTKITNVNNALTPAPPFVSFSIYAWSSSAVDVNGVIYGAGANHGSKHGSLSIPNWLTAYTPTFITSSWQPRIFIVSEGYYGTQWIDVHGNCYSRGTGTGGPGGGTALEPWVKFVGAGVPMFTRLDSNPPIEVKRYTDTPGNTLTVELDRPADEVRYVILYPDDNDIYTFPDPDPFGAPIRERFYDLSFMEFAEPYHFRDTYPQLLLSPNYDKPESRYYANPKITNAVFEEVYNLKAGDNAGYMDPNADSRIFEKQNLIVGNCIVWVQSKNSAGTTRMVYRIDNFYTPANVWMQGVLTGTSPAQDVQLYGPRLAPGPYGIPLNRDKDALAYTEPPLGWDVVQPDPITDSMLWPVWMYYTLAPAGQTEKYAVADAFGVYHRIDPSKEVILDSLDKLTETRTPETTVTFSYIKNPDLWADVNLHFIYDDGSPVSFDGVTPTIPVMETREMMIPIAPARLSDIDPYFPPEAYDENDAAVGYYAGTPAEYTLESPLVYESCTFPDGFNPALSAAAPVNICIIYKKGLLNVSETFWRITDKASNIRSQITNNQGLASIRNAFEPSSVVSRNGSPIENNILFGYELWKESASGYSFEQRHTYEWLSPDPLATGHYDVQAAVIADLEGSDWEIRWLYYPDENQVNGIPDEDEASIVVNWYGRSATGAQSVLKSITIWDLAGTAKNFTENKSAHLAEPERWILSTAENYLSYLPPGNPSPTGTILLAAGAANPSVNFWYNIDANENGLIDEEEFITVRHRLYGEDQNDLGKPDVVVKPFLLGDTYYGSPTAHVIPGYTAVGWCIDAYDDAMPDEELHLIESTDDSLNIYFETDPLAGNGQIMTILYMGIAAPITVRFRLVTYTGTEFEMPPQTLTGLIGQDVTALVQDPVAGNPMWLLDEALSVLPPDSRFVLRNTPQEFLYHYKENLTYSFITVAAASTDDRLSFEYPAIRELATAAPFPVQADTIPNYVVTGYQLYNANGVQIKTGLGDICVVDPRDGHQRLVFTYVSLDTEVYVKCIGPEGQVLDDMFYTARIGQKYTVRAPYISTSYSLVGDLMQMIDPVLGGTNVVVFQYAYTEGARIEFYEVGKTEPIMQRNVTSPYTFTESYLEGLLSNLWQYNEEVSGISLPLNIDTQNMMDEEVFRLYFDKILVPVMLVAVNDRDSSEIERITKYYDDSGELPYPSNWLRAGEMEEVVTEAILGYSLKAEDRRLEYIEASSTVAVPQEIEFLYLENEMGLVRVLMYYGDSETNVLQEYTIQIQVGGAFTASAPLTYPGFALTPGQENPQSIFVEDGENTIKFHYDDLRKELTIKMDTKGTVETYSSEKLPVGTSRTVWPPFKLDHVAVAMSIDGGVTKTNIGSGFTGYDITLTDDTEILFYYLPISEVVDEYVIVVTVRGVTMGPGSSELYSYTTFKAKNSGAFTVNALPYNGYVLLDPSSSPATLMAAESPITQTFTYQNLTTTVTIYAQDGSGNPIPGFSPINAPATEGQPFSYNAPYILGWNLTGAATQTIPAVAAGGNAITFVYAQASGNVTVILKEGNAAGPVIKTLSMDLNVGNSPLTVPIPDLSGENYSPVTVPAQTPAVLTYDGNAHEVEYYYTKNARTVSLRTIDITDPGLPVQIGSDIAAGSYSVGEVASFDAPTLTGYKLESTTPLLVMITAGGGAQIVEFNYTSRAEGELVVQSIYSGDGTILQTYTITGTIGQSFSVPAPSLTGYKLAAAEPPSKTGRVPDTISFTYDLDVGTVRVITQDRGGNAVAPMTSYEMPIGLSHTVYAPHVPGYVLTGVGSLTFASIAAGTQDAVFTYISIAEIVDDYVIVVTVRGVTMGPGSSELYSYTTFKAKNSGAFTVNALPYNGYVLLDPSSSPATLMAAESPITQTFTYQNLTTTVTIYAQDGSGNPVPGFSPINAPATEGQPFSYNAPYILGWNLTGAATQTIPAVAAGGNAITFVYAQASGNVTVILKEGNAAGSVIKTLSMDLNVGNSPLTVPIPDLSGENYSLVTVPAQSPAVLTYDGNAHEVEYYYIKNARAVSLRTIDITDPGLPVQIGSDIAAGSYSVGEVASFDAPTLTGYKLESTTPLLVMITAGGGTQIVEFNYTTRAEGELVVQSVYSGDGTILQTYTITGTVGQSFSVPAPSITGYKLATMEPPSKTGRVPDTISFTYDKDVGTVRVVTQDSGGNAVAPATSYEMPVGLSHTVYAPHVPGYVLTGVGSLTFASIAAGTQDAVFTYISIAEIVDEYVIVVTVRGVTAGPGSSELYSYTTFKAKNSGAFTVNALPYNGYVLLDPSSSPATLTAAESPITQTFTYQNLATTVTIYAQDGSGNPVPGFSPINAPATEGQPFSYNAPYILGWNLTGAATQTIPAVAAGGSTLTFVYAQASGNVTVILKEGNAAGPVIKTLSMDLNVGNSPLTVPIPDLSGENYSLVTVPAQTPAVLAYDGDAHEVEYYYTKNARTVSLRTIDITDPGLPVQIGSDIAAGSYSVGEVASFVAPTLTGYKLESTTPLLVMITAGGGAQIVEFNYTTRAEGELVVQSVYSGDGTILQTYTITGTVGQSFSVPAPSLAGYKLAAAEPPSKTGRVPDTISFTYDKDTVTVTVELQDKDAVPLMPAESYELARGLTHTVYAPHLPGYGLISAGSIVFTDIASDRTAVFVYESLAAPESREISVYTSLDEAAPVHHETLRIIQGEDAEIYAPYLNGYILIGYMLDAGGRVPVTSLSENTVRIPNVHSDGNLIFYYQSIDTYVEEEYVNIIVRGVDKTNGTDLYSHTVTVRKSDAIKEIKAFEVAGYTLIPPASIPLVSDGSRAEVVFEYTNQSTYVVIKAELQGGGPVPGFSDIYVPAQIGQQFSYYAPYIPGYMLQDDIIKILSSVEELDTVTFLYDESLGNVLILLKEDNADGKVIKAISESLEMGESAFYSADSYDLSAEFYTAIGPQTCEVEGGDTWTTIEFYFERMMRGVDIELFNKSSNSVIGYFYKQTFPIGDVAVIRAPGVSGLMLESDNPAFVLIQEGSGNQTLRFDYTEVTPDCILVYAVNDAEPNEILHSFSMNGEPGAALRVNAPIVPGYRLKAGEKYTVEQSVPGVVIFPYEEDFGAYATVNYVLIDHLSGKEIAAPQWIETQYTVLAGSDFTAQAPQLPGYQIVGNQTYKQRVEGVGWTVEFYYIATHDPATVTVRYLNRSSENALIKEELLSGYYVGQIFAPKEHVPETFNYGGRRYALDAEPIPPVSLESANVVEVFYLDAGPERLGGGETIIELEKEPEFATLVIHCTDIVTGQLIFIQVVNAVVGKEETISSPLIDGYSLDASSPATQTIIIEKEDNIVNFTYVNLFDLVLPAPPIQLPPMSVPIIGPVPELYLFLNEPPVPLSNLIMETFETEKHISYIYGYPDGTMQPDMAITRAEAAVIFWRLLKSDDKESYMPQMFPDVENGKWYAQAINYLASIRILVGFEDGTFRPQQTITRAEFAAIASRFDSLDSGIDNPFADVPETHWARESIVSAYAKGWINGYPGGEFQPGASITRAEVVAVVNRMMGRALNSNGIPLNQFTYYYSDLSPSHWAAPTIMEASVYHEYEVQGYEIWTLW